MYSEGLSERRPGTALASEASDRKEASLFPLRFTPFELYFWLERRPDYPPVFLIRLECCGMLDRGAFEQAFLMAHARHPLLSARIELDHRGRPMWRAGEPPPIEWLDEDSG